MVIDWTQIGLSPPTTTSPTLHLAGLVPRLAGHLLGVFQKRELKREAAVIVNPLASVGTAMLFP